MSGMIEHTELILDGTKLAWHMDRVRAWERGERIAVFRGRSYRMKGKQVVT